MKEKAKRPKYVLPGDDTRIKELIGKRFARLVIKEYVGRRSGYSLFSCLCDCGKTKNIILKTLISGRSRSCGCLSKEINSRRSWKGIGEISSSFITQIKRNANKRNIKFDVTEQEIWDKYVEQNQKCQMSGLSIDFVRSTRTSKQYATASLDRIDSSKNYTVDNIQWVHKTINKMKFDLHQDEFLNFVYLICNPIPDDGVYNSYSLDPTYSTKCHTWKGYGNLPRAKYASILKGAKDRDLIVDISIQDCWDLFVKQNGRCAITGIKLSMATYRSSVENTASLDRINSDFGYTIDNVQWVHKKINNMKWANTYTDLLHYCHIINRHQNMFGGVSSHP